MIQFSKTFLQTLLLLCIGVISQAQTTLSAGDMAIIGWDNTTNKVRIVTLVNIASGTTIYLTDLAWQNFKSGSTTATGAWDALGVSATAEGVITWTTGTSIAAGTVLDAYFPGGTASPVTLTTVDATPVSQTITISSSPVAGFTAGDPMGNSGDNFFIYQGSAANPYFIAGFNNFIVNQSPATIDATGWTPTGNLTVGRGVSSTLPDGIQGCQNALTNGTNAIGIPSANLGYKLQYTGPITATDKATWLARFTNISNWTSSGASATPVVTNTVTGPISFTASGPTITTQPSTTAQSLIAGATATTLTVATSATSPTYQWYSNSTASNTGGTAVGGATGASFTPPTSVSGTTYYYVVVTAGGASTTSAVSGAVTVCNGVVPTAKTNSTQTQANTVVYGTCSAIIAAVTTTNATNQASGSTTATVWIDGTQNAQYVKRHYEIKPATDGAGTVTLYFTQAEFDAYNAVNTIKLPTGSADAAGKANLKIRKYAGSTNDAAKGTPDTYTGAATNIDPADANIVWNATASRWEVTFDVTGFSGFFVTANNLFLPVTFGDVTAVFKNGQLLVNFSTMMENNNSHFDIEVSKDGQNFTKISTLNSQYADGNSSQPTLYNATINKNSAAGYLGVGLLLFGALISVGFNRKNRFLLGAMFLLLGAGFGATSCKKADQQLANASSSNLYVRVAQVDKDGTINYSKVVKVVVE